MAHQHHHQRPVVRFAGTATPEPPAENPLYPPPVFSPTHEQDESVLHSIFSPTLRDRASSSSSSSEAEKKLAAARANASEKKTGGFFSQQPALQSTSNLQMRSPKPYNATASTGSGQLVGNRSSRAFLPIASKSPSPRSNMQQNNRESPTLTTANTIIDNDVFYSPASSLDMTSPRSVVSGKSQKSTSSFGALRDVTLLDLDNIKKCNSVNDLENVIQVLNGEGKFQALLRMAKSRLEAILETTGRRLGGGNPPPPPPPPKQQQQQQQQQEQNSQPRTRSTFFSSQPEPSPFFHETPEQSPMIGTAGKHSLMVPTSRFFQQNGNDQTTTTNTTPSFFQQPEHQNTVKRSSFFQPLEPGGHASENRSTLLPSPSNHATNPTENQVGVSKAAEGLENGAFVGQLKKTSPRPIPRSPRSHKTATPTTGRLTPTGSSRMDQQYNSNPHFGIQIESPQSRTPSSSRAPSPANSKGSPDEAEPALNETNESSLVMSVSTSILESTLEEMNLGGGGGVGQAQTAAALANSRNFVPLNVDTKRLSGSYGYLSPSPVSSARYDRPLSEDMKKLTETIMGMETSRAADRKMFLEKLNSLEEKKNNADERIRTIETMMEQSATSTRDLLASLQHLRAEGRELQEIVQAERAAWSDSFVKAQERESQLGQKAEELAQLLSAHSSNAGQAAEEKVRKQYESLLHLKQRENQELENNLRETLGNLLVALGRSKNEVHQMSKEQQKHLVSTFAQKHLASKAATDALAQEVAALEKERKEASQQKQQVSVQLEKSKMRQLQLEEENRHLHDKIQQLSKELNDMRKYLEDISSNGIPRASWKEQEQKYQDIIRNLKSQLRKEETMVSVGLYKNAMDSAKEKNTEIEQQQIELGEWKARFSILEQRLLENEKKHSNTLASSLKHQAEKKECDKKITDLQQQLREERQSSKQALDKASQESKKLRRQMDDLKFEMQENGGRAMSKSPNCTVPKSSIITGLQPARNVAPRSISPSPRNRLLDSPAPVQMSPKKREPRAMTPAKRHVVSSITPSKTPGSKPLNDENDIPSRNVGGKQPTRSKFDFVQKKGGRKAMREQIQKMRSPKARSRPTAVKI